MQQGLSSPGTSSPNSWADISSQIDDTTLGRADQLDGVVFAKGEPQKDAPGLVSLARMRPNNVLNPSAQTPARVRSSRPKASAKSAATTQAENASENWAINRPKYVDGFLKFRMDRNKSLTPFYLHALLKSGIRPKSPMATAHAQAAGPEKGAHSIVVPTSYAENATLACMRRAKFSPARSGCDISGAPWDELREPAPPRDPPNHRPRLANMQIGWSSATESQYR